MSWCWDTLSHIFIALPQFSEILMTSCEQLYVIEWISKCLFIMLWTFYSDTITCFWLRELETWSARSVAVWYSRSLRRNIFFLSLCSKSILLCMHSNHVQNKSKVSVNPAEELRIQSVIWWSPWEGLLINKGALLPNAPHHWMTAHSH